MKNWISLLLFTATLGMVASSAWAQETDEETDDATVEYSKVTAKGVGVIGGITAGAEVVLVVESIIRVKPLWPYIVFPIAGAVGGGIGGYKLEAHTKGGAIALLITSMVGIIPTVMATSSARSFHPEDVGAQKGGETIPAFEYTEEYARDGDSEADAVVEIESRPDGISDAPMGPPPPSSTNAGQSDGAGYTPAYELDVDSGDAESGDSEPEMTGPETTEPDGNDPDATAPESRLPDDRKERLAHLSSGALLHMNRHFRFGMGIPAIDVVPVQLPGPWMGQKGIAFHIPLIVLDLP